MAVWIKAAEAMALLGIKRRAFFYILPEFQSRPGAKQANGKYEREILLESMPEGAQIKYWGRKGEGRNADSYQPSVISRQPSAISCQPSAIGNQPSAISRQSSVVSRNRERRGVQGMRSLTRCLNLQRQRR